MFVHGCQCEKVRGRICLTVSLCKRKKKGNDATTEREAEKEYGHEGSERAREHGGDCGERERERERER